MSVENPNASVRYDDRQIAALQFVGGVSWSAVFAGATVAASLSLILLLLGVGFGFSAVSPWSGEGVGGEALGISAIIWITLMSLIASAVGGYVAGRLRQKWVGVLSDEVYFRDTAHGLLAWGVSTLVMVSLLASATTALVGSGAKAAGAVAGGLAASASAVAAGAADSGDWQVDGSSLDYFVDSLFRDRATASQQNESMPADQRNMEVARIFTTALSEGEALPENDRQYIARLVADNTRLTQQQAENRVREVYDRTLQRLEEMEAAAREAADTARKASAYTSLWLSIAFLVGAFVASLAAVCGGRQRDI